MPKAQNTSKNEKPEKGRSRSGGQKTPAYQNATPREEIPEGSPVEIVKREMARRLSELLASKGWNQSELARQAALHTADGTFGRDNVSNYIRGRVIPGPPHLGAMAKALGCSPADILPLRTLPNVDRDTPSLDTRDIDGTTAWLRVNQRVPWPVAIEVMRLLKGAEEVPDHK